MLLVKSRKEIAIWFVGYQRTIVKLSTAKHKECELRA